jgi:hypothetical protein
LQLSIVDSWFGVVASVLLSRYRNSYEIMALAGNAEPQTPVRPDPHNLSPDCTRRRQGRGECRMRLVLHDHTKSVIST